MPDYFPVAQQALDFAAEETMRTRHKYIGSEALLLGLHRASSEVRRLLNATTYEKLRDASDSIVGRGTANSDDELLQTAPLECAISNASERANGQPVGPINLLEALLDSEDGTARGMLQIVGISGGKLLYQTRIEMVRRMPSGVMRSRFSDWWGGLMVHYHIGMKILIVETGLKPERTTRNERKFVSEIASLAMRAKLPPHEICGWLRKIADLLDSDNLKFE